MVNAVIHDFLGAPPLKGSPKIRYPGQGMLASRRENPEKGILVDLELWQMIQQMQR
jgi:LDH2 family malate/lactate/ureidoglycolate dehydrogenase